MKSFSVLLAACLAVRAALAADAAPIAIEQFFQQPAMSGASISPDGRHIALRMRSPAGRSMLKVLDAETHAQKVVANFQNVDVDTFYWLDSVRLVYTVVHVDHGGDIGKPGLYGVDRDGKDFTPISDTVIQQRSFADSMPISNAYQKQGYFNGFQSRIPDALYVMAVTPQDAALARIDTRVGIRSFTNIRAPAGTFYWLTGPDGKVSVTEARRDGKNVVLFRDDKQWRELATFEDDAPDAFVPLLYAGGTLYVRAYRGKNESAVYRYDLHNKAMIDRPVITVPGFDADGYFLTGDQDMLGFRIHTDSENTVWFDPAMQALQQEVDTRLPDTINTVSYGQRSETAFAVVDAHRDIQDHLYFLYNRDSKKLLQLGAARPQLDPDRMARTGMVRYAARDGMPIPAYVTLPATPSNTPAPTVVLLGNALKERNGNWEWNAEVQFLASRGYVVLQPNPRGSSGFGAAHRQAGKGQSGAAVLDDLADAVNWAVGTGHSDPARVCIAGSGEGGYAALAALARHPAVFRCGISWSGATELDGAPLDAVRIRRPVLLAYGKEDMPVPFSAGQRLRDALAAGNPQVEWLEYTPSVEDWKTQANRIDLWRHIEAFLARQIGPGASPGS